MLSTLLTSIFKPAPVLTKTQTLTLPLELFQTHGGRLRPHPKSSLHPSSKPLKTSTTLTYKFIPMPNPSPTSSLSTLIPSTPDHPMTLPSHMSPRKLANPSPSPHRVCQQSVALSVHGGDASEVVWSGPLCLCFLLLQPL